MLSIKKGVAPGPPPPGRKMRIPMTDGETAIGERVSGWKMGGLYLSPGMRMVRGTSYSGSRTSMATLHVRTKDPALDAASAKAMAGIAAELSLRPEYCAVLNRLVFSPAVPKTLPLLVAVTYEGEKPDGPAHYRLHVTAYSCRTAAPCEYLAEQFGARLFALKEKPHFGDACSAAFEAALAGP